MRAVIFDMDGLLIDSERIISEAYAYAGKCMGYDDMWDAAVLCIGRTAPAARKIFTDRYGVDLDMAECQRLKHEYVEKNLPGGHFPAMPFAQETIKELSERGYLLALATSTRRGSAEPSLEHIGVLEYFDVTVCGDQIANGKPDPEIFLTAAAELGVLPQECFVAEDSFNGIKAAHAAGAVPVMVPDLIPPDDEMRRLAAYIAEDLNDAKDFILNYKPLSTT